MGSHAERPVEISETEQILNKISETIVSLNGKLSEILTPDPAVGEDKGPEGGVESKLRRRLGSILTELNILYSRIQL